MLPRPLRIRRADEHRHVARDGRRASVGAVTVHLLRVEDGPPRAGLVVGKGVGNSVDRHRVSRQLRHLVAPWLAELPPGTLVVVRARPGAAGAAEDLAGDLGAAMTRGARPAQRSSGRPSRPPAWAIRP